MPRDHIDATPGFRIHSESWWAAAAAATLGRKGDDVIDEIMVGFYDTDRGVIGAGGTSGEFAFVWYKLAGKSAIRLECYSDGWSSLIRIPRLLNMMNDIDSDARYTTGDISPQQFGELLKSIGIRDMTNRTGP